MTEARPTTADQDHPGDVKLQCGCILHLYPVGCDPQTEIVGRCAEHQKS